MKGKSLEGTIFYNYFLFLFFYPHLYVLYFKFPVHRYFDDTNAL